MKRDDKIRLKTRCHKSLYLLHHLKKVGFMVYLDTKRYVIGLKKLLRLTLDKLSYVVVQHGRFFFIFRVRFDIGQLYNHLLTHWQMRKLACFAVLARTIRLNTSTILFPCWDGTPKCMIVLTTRTRASAIRKHMFTWLLATMQLLLFYGVSIPTLVFVRTLLSIAEHVAQNVLQILAVTLLNRSTILCQTCFGKRQYFSCRKRERLYKVILGLSEHLFDQSLFLIERPNGH